MTWLIAGPILGAALVLAWTWWRLRVESRAIHLETLRWQSDACDEHLRQHQRAFTAMDPKYVGRDLIVQVDFEREARDIQSKFEREYDKYIRDSRALAEQRRLDEMEL